MSPPSKNKETKTQRRPRTSYTKRKILRIKKRGVSADGAFATATSRSPRKRKLRKPVEIPTSSQSELRRKPLNTSSLMHRGDLFHLGDVIRVIGKDSLSYFGQILRFWADDYTEKYAEICWLVPHETIQNNEEFIPSKYKAGPHQPEPINMRGIVWVMKAESYLPSTYAPVFNRCGELGKLFNENIPNNTTTSIAKCKL